MDHMRSTVVNIYIQRGQQASLAYLAAKAVKKPLCHLELCCNTSQEQCTRSDRSIKTEVER